MTRVAIKRRLREAFRHFDPSLAAGLDVVVAVRRHEVMKTPEYAGLLREAIERVGRLARRRARRASGGPGRAGEPGEPGSADGGGVGGGLGVSEPGSSESRSPLAVLGLPMVWLILAYQARRWGTWWAGGADSTRRARTTPWRRSARGDPLRASLLTLRRLLRCPPARGLGDRPAPGVPAPARLRPPGTGFRLARAAPATEVSIHSRERAHPEEAPDAMTRLPAAKRREQLLDTAVTLFAERGFSGATTSELAKAAGVTEPIIYRHFRSKKDLFIAVIERTSALTLEMWERQLRTAKNPAQRLRRLIGANPMVSEQGRGAYRVVVQAMMEIDDPDVLSALQEHITRIHRFVTHEVLLAQEEGQVSKRFSAEISAWLLLHLGLGYGVLAPLNVPHHALDDHGVRVRDVVAELMLGERARHLLDERLRRGHTEPD